jgi:hypothetical protein
MFEKVDELEELIERIKGFAPEGFEPLFWKPEPGDHIVGLLDHFGSMQGASSNECCVTIVGKLKKHHGAESSGVYQVCPVHPTLVQKLKRADLHTLDPVGIIRKPGHPADPKKEYTVLTEADLPATSEGAGELFDEHRRSNRS